MIIAEIGQAHDGSLGILHSYIDALAVTGVDAIKFQVHIAEAESSHHEQFRVPFSYVDKTRFDYWKRMEFSLEQWIQIRDHVHAKGMQFIASPFSCAAVSLLQEAEVDVFKVGSGEITNHLLLENIAATRKPVILSSGMSTMAEIDAALALFTERNIPVSILQCTTAYPTQPEQWGLPIINSLKNRYNVPVGFSDHSGTTTACLAATAVGAEILEFHVVFDRRMFGPDATSSLEIDEVKELVESVKMIRRALSAPFTKDGFASEADPLKELFGKSLAVNRSFPAGHIIRQEDLEAKKPAAFGLSPAGFKAVVGKTLTRAVEQWDFLQAADIR
jgi:N,N'-diacetyllegionaminate synthase